MGKRSSVKKANWSVEREELYQEESNKILFDRQWNVIINNNDVYLRSAEKEGFFLKITKPKTMWYELWLRLKDI